MLQLSKLLYLVPLLLLSLTTSADAQRIRLETRMGANDSIQAQAKYEQRGARRKFNLELEDASPIAVYGVRIMRGTNLIEWDLIRANRFGFAEIDIDTFEGDAVPTLQAGDMVEIWFNRQRILAGVLENQ
jgi:hypothetical protein